MKRKLFSYRLAGLFLFPLLALLACTEQEARPDSVSAPLPRPSVPPSTHSHPITLFMAGDVMLGRGIDQVLPHPGDPLIHEPALKSARGYVELAERANGPISKPVDFSYIWRDTLAELARVAPDVVLINPETSINSRGEPDTGRRGAARSR